jgi:hypothetical protein
MALTKCSDCEREVSQEAWACPGCGKPFRSPWGIKAKTAKWALGIWIVLIFAFIVLWQVLNQPAR